MRSIGRRMTILLILAVGSSITSRCEGADNIEKSDQANRDNRPARRDTEIADVGRKMRGDKRNLKSANKKTGR